MNTPKITKTQRAAAEQAVERMAAWTIQNKNPICGIQKVIFEKLQRVAGPEAMEEALMKAGF